INYMTSDYGTFDMGTAYNVRAELPIQYRLSKNFSISAIPYYSYWHFNASNTQNVVIDGYQVTAHEPSSETNSLGFNLGLNYKF
ncbi:MAG: hypothetical protein ACP5OE_09070, partial [Thermodesulfobium sp.]